MADPTVEDLINAFSRGPAAPASNPLGGPNYAAALGAGPGLGWSAEDAARYGISAALANTLVGDTKTSYSVSNIRELERTGGASGAGSAGGVQSEAIGSVLQRITAMQTNELTILQQQLYLAGFYAKSTKPEDIKWGVADSATTKAFADLLKAAANTAGDKTWSELLGEQVQLKTALQQQEAEAAAKAAAEAAEAQRKAAITAAENAYRAANSPEARARVAETLKELGAELPSLVEHYDPQKTIQSLNPDQARSALTSAFKAAVGRAPTEGELRTFVSNYNSAAKRNPIVTQGERNAEGVVTTRSSGGVDSQPIAESLYKNNPEYANYQAVATYFPAIERVLAGKDLTTL